MSHSKKAREEFHRAADMAILAGYTPRAAYRSARQQTNRQRLEAAAEAQRKREAAALPRNAEQRGGGEPV